MSTNDAHGTNCAGIVAAVANNGIGVAGVAYNAKIIPVRIAYGDGYGYWVTNDSWIANGINWAVNQGADVLSCSWGGGSSSSTITGAINNAVTNGRNINGVKKGSVVLFSSGNNNSSVSYPASLSNVIAVGASSMCDERKNPSSCDGEYLWGSNYGTGIDVVAPGVKIYSTDISGSAGYSSDDYFSSFNGTSSACPNTAGVAALILSVNPNLTQSQVRQILESSTDKVSGYVFSSNVSGQPNGTWNNEVGHGRINACNAVNETHKTIMTITGPPQVCTSSSQFTLNNVHTGATVTWQATPSYLFAVSSGNGTNPVLSAVNTYASGQGTVTFTINLGCGNPILISKTFLVGAPMASGISFGIPTTMHVNETVSITVEYPPIGTRCNLADAQLDVYGAIVVPGGVPCYPNNNTNKNIYFNQSTDPVVVVRAKVKNTCGWSDWSLPSVIRVTGGSFKYSIYPNPASETLTIQKVYEKEGINQKDNMQGLIKSTSVQNYAILDSNGNLLLHGVIIEKEQVDISSLKKGIYIIVIIVDNTSTETHQVIVE